MKILMVITKADEIGGAQTHVLDLSRELLQKGHEVTILVGENGAFVDRLNYFNIPVIIERTLVREINLLKDFRFIFKLRRLIKLAVPDLVHLHSSKAGLLGRFSSLRTGIPVVFTAHGWSFAEGIPKKNRVIYSFLERHTSKLLNRIITVSQHDKDLALSFRICAASKIDVIHNGTPESTLPVLNEPNNSLLKIIMVARFSKQKDHKTLLLALSKLKHLDWQLDLVGKGGLFDYFVDLAKELGLSERVNFLGERNDIDSLLMKSDIFCLISNWEGFPISIVEAMRLGLPIIASDVGGVNESVEDNVNGFLIPRNNEAVLEKRMEEVINNCQLRKEFGNHSLDKFNRYFTSDAMLKKTIATYISAISSTGN